MESRQLILCDTNIIIEFYKNNLAIVSALRSIGQENIGVSTVTIGELMYGALNKSELRQIMNDIDSIETLHISEGVCKTFLDLMARYALSHKPSIPDLFIAATALYYEVPLFTLNNKDFRFIQGLVLHQL